MKENPLRTNAGAKAAGDLLRQPPAPQA
jgi:hypothetical protein